jgi:hypothetical protein
MHVVAFNGWDFDVERVPGKPWDLSSATSVTKRLASSSPTVKTSPMAGPRRRHIKSSARIVPWTKT